MKETTKKILLALYPTTDDAFFKLPQSALALLVPELSPEGRRSLIYLLEKRGMIQTVRLQGTQYCVATEKARRALEDVFPALHSPIRSAKHNWTVVAFSKAPKGDPQFRYLRNKLLQEGAIGLARGVYVFGSQLPASIEVVLEKLYEQHVLVFSVDQWLFGSEKPIIFKHFHVSETVEAYSSISKELDRLLSIFDSKKRLVDKNKLELCKIYVRWFETISEDKGFSSRYFPQEASGLSLLSSFQTLLLYM